ncbi:MAG: hypothetical protein ACJA1V_000957, partial [Flavobacteriaceae bacterium]
KKKILYRTLRWKKKQDLNEVKTSSPSNDDASL